MRGAGIAAAVALAVGVFAGCGGGDAEMAAAAAAAGPATSAEDARSAWVRVTPDGLTALPRALLGTLPASGRIELGTERHGDLTLCTGGACTIELAPERLSLSPRADGSLGVSVSVRAAARRIGVRYEQSWACAFSGRAECTVDVDTTRAGAPALTATASLVPRIDEASGLASLALTDVRVPTGLDGGDVRVAGANACGGIWCTVANAIGATRWIAGQANVAVVRGVEREAASRTCLPCSAGCAAGARCEDGVCRMPGGACVPRPLAVAARLDAPDGRGQSTVALALADEAGLRRGAVDLALRVTARVDERHPCAPASDPPAATPLPRTILEGDLAPGTHVRVALSEAAIARAAWGVHQAGITCVDVDATQVPQLDAAMLAIVLPSSLRLAPLGIDAPGVAVRPLAPPRIAVEDDGAVTVQAERVRMDIEAVVDGRRLRLASATLRAAATARLAAHDGELAIVASPDDVSVEVVDVWSAPILGAADRELRDTFDALSSAAIGVIPEAVPLDRIPVPGRLVPLATRGVDAAGTRALVMDLALRDAPEAAASEAGE